MANVTITAHALERSAVRSLSMLTAARPAAPSNHSVEYRD
jgi:hypothetical protein